MADTPATGVSYGGSGDLHVYRAKTTLDRIDSPDGSGAAATADKELILSILGKPQVTPQDDGTFEISFPHAENRKKVSDFTSKYREQAASGSKSAYKSHTGVEFGGDGDISNVLPVFFTYHAGVDPDTGDTLVLAGFAKVLASSGGFTIDPDNATERSLTLRSLIPKADTAFHDGGQSPTFTTLDMTIIDGGVGTVAENSVSVLQDDPNIEFWFETLA